MRSLFAICPISRSSAGRRGRNSRLPAQLPRRVSHSPPAAAGSKQRSRRRRSTTALPAEREDRPRYHASRWEAFQPAGSHPNARRSLARKLPLASRRVEGREAGSGCPGTVACYHLSHWRYRGRGRGCDDARKRRSPEQQRGNCKLNKSTGQRTDRPLRLRLVRNAPAVMCGRCSARSF